MAERLRRAIWLAEYIGNERKRAADAAQALVSKLLDIAAHENCDPRCPPREVVVPAGARGALATLKTECHGLPLEAELAALTSAVGAPPFVPRAQLAFVGMLS